jgi:RNA polymerase sigma-70 factor (ECF subfamily)
VFAVRRGGAAARRIDGTVSADGCLVTCERGRMCRAGVGGDMQQTLVERAQAGDHDAFSVLVRRAYPRLFGIATLILRDRDRAQDAVQDALVLAWRNIRALRDADAWDAWLYRLTVRACQRMARQVRHRDVVEIPVAEELDRVDAADLAQTIVDRDRMARALGRLPIDQRTVLVLHFYADLPLTHAASVLEIPVGTAKSRLNRGLAALRTAMGAEREARMDVMRERPA